MDATLSAYRSIQKQAHEIFKKKLQQYGVSWKHFRPITIVDQVFIKANRIRTIEETQKQHTPETIEEDLIGIVNYCLIALILLDNASIKDETQALDHYEQQWQQTLDLMQQKNTDYGDAWRQMHVFSFTDIILSRLERLKKLLNNHADKATIKDQWRDILNYAMFYLIRLKEATT